MKEHMHQTKPLTEPENHGAMHRMPELDFPAAATAFPDQIRKSVRKTPADSGAPRILVVTDDDPLAKTVHEILRCDGLVTEQARNLLEALEAARSGQFPVAITTPRLTDGSWKRLVWTAHHVRPRFSVIVLAKTFSLREWAQALDDGAFEVIDALSELPKMTEVVRHALLTEYLLGERPDLQIPGFWRPS